MNRWKFRIGVVLVFLVGLAIGCLGTGWWFAKGFHDLRGPRDKVEARLMKHLSWYLDLTDDQKAKMQPIVHDFAVKMEDLRAKAEPQIQAVMEEGLQRAKPILTADQYERMEKRYKEMRDKWKRRRE